jgi:Fe-S-cluster containining protein
MTLEMTNQIVDILLAGGASQEELGVAPKLEVWAKNFGECISCPYVLENGGGCAIYDNRPFLCRLFGTIPSMPCPHGAGPEQMLSLAEERALMHDYHKLVAKVQL